MEPSSFEDDDALRRRCIAGEPAAWEALVARHLSLVVRIARNILSRRGLPARADDVEEAAAEFFGDLCATRRESLGAYRGKGTLRGYLAVLAANHVRRRAEMERRRRSRFGLPLEAVAEDERLATPADLGAAESEELDRVLAGLTDAERHLFRILFVDEMESEAAAERLGITVPALYIRKHRLLKRIRAIADERSATSASSPGRGERESSQGHEHP